MLSDAAELSDIAQHLKQSVAGPTRLLYVGQTTLDEERTLLASGPPATHGTNHLTTPIIDSQGMPSKVESETIIALEVRPRDHQIVQSGTKE
jgi:hypothetical protein